MTITSPKPLICPLTLKTTSKLIYVVVFTSQNNNITLLTARNGDWSRGWVSSSIWLSHLAVCATLLSQSHAKLIHIYQGLGYQLFGIQLGSRNLYPNDPTSLRTLQIIANYSHWSMVQLLVPNLIRPTNGINVMSTTDRFLEVL